MKIASTGDVIGTVQQDRATTIAGTLGPGPSMIPITLTLNSERGTRKTFTMASSTTSCSRRCSPTSSILNTLTSYERQNGVGTYALKRRGAREEPRRCRVRGSVHRRSAVGRRRRLRRRRRSTCCCGTRSRTCEFEGLNLEIDASETAAQRDARARVDRRHASAKPGAPVDLKSCCAPTAAKRSRKSLPVQIPANARGSVSIMVADARAPVAVGSARAAGAAAADDAACRR